MGWASGLPLGCGLKLGLVPAEIGRWGMLAGSVGGVLFRSGSIGLVQQGGNSRPLLSAGIL
ncbi:MAG: hypothetical protein ACO34J_16140 [Prochlorothrix sp.]